MSRLELDWPRHRPVLAACSGGGDSLALVCLLREQGWQVEVAHLDHAGRPDSHQQARVLQELCRSWGLVFHGRRLNVGAWARRYGFSWEAAGRELRYAWLGRLAQQRQALLVTGHSAEDQAETVLMRLLQGCTLVGLAGIYPRGVQLARPLLGWRREQLRQVLQERGIAWFEDPGNQDLRFLRVQVRQQVLPLLLQLNQGVVEHLGQLAGDALELRSLLQRPRPLVQLTRLEFEERLHQLWLSLPPPPGSRWWRRHAQEIYASLSQSQWRCWNLPGNTWAEWDGHRLSLGRPLPLPRQAPEGLVWRFRLPGDVWQGRALKKVFHDWSVPRRARDQTPLLVRPPHQVEAVQGWRCGEAVAAWVKKERSGLVIVEAAGRDDQTTD